MKEITLKEIEEEYLFKGLISKLQIEWLLKRVHLLEKKLKEKRE